MVRRPATELEGVDEKRPSSLLDRSSPAERAEELGDARLVEAARAGDVDAFAALVVRYERKLVRVLCRLLHDEELARDLAQETFWKVYHRLDRFDTARRFGPWLFRVGLNLCLDQLRRRGSDALPAESLDRHPGGSPAGVMEADPRGKQELAQEVRHVLSMVPLSYRSILVLKDLEGFSTAEVAAIVGRQEATIRWRLSKARVMFREAWESREREIEQRSLIGSTEPGGFRDAE
jgi:RNA polymerase sigma-70 factor (ECF subfamily)